MKTKVDWQLGVVDWFDDQSGEGFIRDEDGRLHYLHYSAIEAEGRRKTIQKDSKVEFCIYDEPQARRVLKAREV